MNHIVKILVLISCLSLAPNTGFAKDGEYSGITHPVYASAKESIQLRILAERVFLDLTLARIALADGFEDGTDQILGDVKHDIDQVTDITDNHITKIFIPAVKITGTRGGFGA